jgi:hypothetical protein
MLSLGIVGSLVLVGLVVGFKRPLGVAWGAWCSSGAWAGPTSYRTPLPKRPPPDPPPPPPKHGELYVPTYLPTRDTPPDVASTLAVVSEQVSLAHVIAVCTTFGIRAEVRDVKGRMRGVVGPKGRGGW